MIVGRIREILPGAKIPLRRLYARVPKQYLDLLQLASSGAAQLR
jgi:hypothetical protein